MKLFDISFKIIYTQLTFRDPKAGLIAQIAQITHEVIENEIVDLNVSFVNLRNVF